MDADFDGIITKPDLKKFLVSTIEIPDNQLPEVTIDRVYKLMDIYKRGFILKNDLKKILNDDKTADYALDQRCMSASKSMSFFLISFNFLLEGGNNNNNTHLNNHIEQKSLTNTNFFKSQSIQK